MGAKTILVIEDDDVTRMGFARFLTDHGYRVALASSGQGGLDYLQNCNPPDLILLDMLMPEMDGWQFLKYRGGRWASVPVFIVTAIPITTSKWAASLGACNWLQKPVDADALLEQVGKCLGETCWDEGSPC
jgi:CheY-like chemotaxis protein